VVDNFSRRLLARKLEEKLSPTTTCEVLAEAAKELPELQSPVTVLADSGVENVNDTVDKFLFGGILKRVLAQVEIVESNSAIEVWWRGLKNFWLYLNVLDTEAAVRRLVAFYVQQYNELMPHSALNFRTPDEVYFGKAEDVPRKLSVARRAAREARLTTNRTTTCEACSASTSSATAFFRGSVSRKAKAKRPGKSSKTNYRAKKSRMSRLSAGLICWALQAVQTTTVVTRSRPNLRCDDLIRSRQNCVFSRSIRYDERDSRSFVGCKSVIEKLPDQILAIGG